jgi:hypothetical protein
MHFRQAQPAHSGAIDECLHHSRVRGNHKNDIRRNSNLTFLTWAPRSPEHFCVSLESPVRRLDSPHLAKKGCWDKHPYHEELRTTRHSMSAC